MPITVTTYGPALDEVAVSADAGDYLIAFIAPVAVNSYLSFPQYEAIDNSGAYTWTAGSGGYPRTTWVGEITSTTPAGYKVQAQEQTGYAEPTVVRITVFKLSGITGSPSRGTTVFDGVTNPTWLGYSTARDGLFSSPEFDFTAEVPAGYEGVILTDARTEGSTGDASAPVPPPSLNLPAAMTYAEMDGEAGAVPTVVRHRAGYQILAAAGTHTVTVPETTWNPYLNAFDHYYTCLIAVPAGGGGGGDPDEDDGSQAGAWCLEDRWGRYHVTHADGSSNLQYGRSDSNRPPFAETTQVTSSGQDTQPRLVLDWRQTIRLVFRRTAGGSASVWETTSDDRGETWSTPVTLFASGKHPTVCEDPLTGAILYAAYVSGTPGTLQGRIQYPGDTSPAAAFTMTGLATPDDAVFHIQPARDGSRRWLLAMKTGGALKNYQSWNDGASWTEVV